ncbi:MAG: DUF3488 and transglutaminase-like domain-containing protein [Planctomycetota bacterium]
MSEAAESSGHRGMLSSMRASVAASIAMGILSFTIASGSLGFLSVIGLGVLIAWMLCPASGRVAPRRAINAGLLGVIGLGILQTLRLGFTVDAFAFFIGLLLVVKLIDLRRPADWGQAITLSAALVVAGVLTSNTLGTGIVLLGSTVVLLRAVLRFQIYAAAVRGGQDTAAPSPVARGASLARVQWGIGVSVFLIGTAVFLFLPRELGTEAFGQWGGASLGQQTGFSDEVTLGQPGLVSESPTPVMDVAMVNQNGENIGSLESPPVYLRGAVLEEYQSGRWKPWSGRGRRSRVLADFVPPGGTIRPWISPRRTPWDRELRITIRNARRGMTPLFTAWEPLELGPVGTGRFISFNTWLGTVQADQARGRLEYRVRTSDPTLRPLKYDPGAVREPVDVSGIPDTVRAYAADIVSSRSISPDPGERPISEDILAVRALTSHLKNTFTYTLEDQPIPPGRDATEWFLNERKTGHCEYFASALAMMCRSIGIDARVVTGYVMTDFNEVTRQYVVRESSAHAWIEARVSEDVWMTFDATPSAEFHAIHQPEPSFTRSVMNIFETIEYAWVTGVVAYDSDTRSRVFGPLSSDFGMLRAGGRMINRLRFGGSDLMARAVGSGVAVFCLSMLVGLIVRHRRDWVDALLASIIARLAGIGGRLVVSSRSPEVRLRQTVNAALRRAGHERAPHEPMRGYIERVSPGLPVPFADQLRAACDLIYEARFRAGPGPQDRLFLQAARAVASSEKRARGGRKPSD